MFLLKISDFCVGQRNLEKKYIPVLLWVELSHKKIVQVLNPGTYEHDLMWNGVWQELTSGIGGTLSLVSGVLVRRGRFGDQEIQGRSPRGGGGRGRGWSDASICQGMPRIVDNLEP